MNDFRALRALVAGRWWVVLSSVAVAVGVAALLCLTVIPRTYTATSRVFVATPAWNDSTASAQPGQEDMTTSYGDEFTQQRMSSYLDVLTSPLVLQPAAAELGESERQVSSVVSGQLVPDTVIIEVSATAPTATEAADRSNAVAAQFVSAVANLERVSYVQTSPVQPEVIAPATPPAHSSSPDTDVYLPAGAAIGVVLGLVAAATLGARTKTTHESMTQVKAWM